MNLYIGLLIFPICAFLGISSRSINSPITSNNGASASGGIGTIIGAIMGGLIMGIINNGMSLMNIGANWQYVVKALVLLLAVWYDIYTRKKAGMV